MTSTPRLAGKNILVTGGSRGIGAGIVQLLAQEGARIALTYTSKPEAAEAVRESLAGEGHLVLAMDVAKSESVEQGMGAVLEKFGQLDGVVNNAGITRDQLILRMKEDDFDAVIATNLKGAFLVSRLAVKAMLRAKRGSIVNISSVVGSMGNPGQTNYAASKAGVEGFTRALALEVASRNIRINSVAPGYIQTDMSEALTTQQKESITSRIPLSRMGHVNDVAFAVAYLLSDESTYVTGQTLHVNGGLYM